jgi:hypothetical protein
MENKKLVTRPSSKELTTSQPKTTKYGTPTVTREELATILARLAVHFAPRGLSTRQIEAMLEDWMTDAGHFPASTIDAACSKWRTDPDSKWFPTPGQLIAICNRIPDPGYQKTMTRLGSRNGE